MAPRDRSVPSPARETLAGVCNVIYAGAEEMDVRRVGRFVADAVGRPIADITRELRNSKGFLATGLDAPKAVALAEKVEQELKAPVLVLPEGEAVALPPPMRMRHAAVDGRGLRCEAYTWDRTVEVAATWNDIFLVSCGRLEIQHAVESASDVPISGLGARPATSLVMQIRHEFLLDIILWEPWRRLRLDQNTSAFSLTEMKRGPDESVGALYRNAVNLDRFAQGVPMNRGVSLLAGGASGSAWQSLTFYNKRDFDSYTDWLVQLVRYGRPIPA